jgi:hypothetical protein
MDELAIIVCFVNLGRGDGWVGVKSSLYKDPLSSRQQMKGQKLEPLIVVINQNLIFVVLINVQ